MVELLEVMPLEENMAPPEGVAPPPEVAAPAASGKGGGKGAAPAAVAADGRREKRLQQRNADARRQNGLLAALVVAAAISRFLGLEASPPMSAHQAMHRLQSQLVEQALHLDMGDAAVEEGLLRLGTKAGVANASFAPILTPSHADNQGAAKRPPPLSATQVLSLFGECSDHWRRKLAQAGRLSAVSAPSTMRPISRRDAIAAATNVGGAAGAATAAAAAVAAASGGAGGALAANELLLAELDRDLADALSRVEFTPERDNKVVLKELLPDLPQAEIMAALPKERQQSYRDQMLTTIATHRESHVVAHAALARLGSVFAELIDSPENLGNVSAERVAELAAEASAAKAAEAEAKAAKEAAAKEAAKAEGAEAEAEAEVDELAETTEEAEASQGTGAEEGGAEVEVGGEATTRRLVFGLFETLGAFSIPTEMSHQEVMSELLQGASSSLEAFPASLHPPVLSQIEIVRARIMEDFIAAGIKELRVLLKANATDTTAAAAAAATAAAAAAAVPGAPAWAGLPNATQAFDLAVELLMQHEMDEAENDTSIAQNLVITLELNGTDVQLVTGAHGVLLEAAAEWRRNKASEAALHSLRAQLLQEQLDSLGAQEGKRRGGATMAAPIEDIPALVGGVLTNYEIAPTMKDDDVVLEILRLGTIAQDSLAVDALYWLSAAVVSHRAARAADSAAAAEAGGSEEAASNATVEIAADGKRQVKLLLPSLRVLSASALVSGKDVPASAYADDAEDAFALLVSSVLTQAGVLTRVSLMCADALSADPADDERGGAVGGGVAGGEGGEGGEGGGFGAARLAPNAAVATTTEAAPACHLTAEVRLGKSAKKIAAWVGAHRKAQKATKKAVKGAKEVFYRRQRNGYLWLSLRWQPGAVEQYPGAAYVSNFTYCVNFGSAGGWEVEGEALDSRGMPVGSAQVGSVLSTM